MKRDLNVIIDQKLDNAIALLKHLLALELAREGISRQAIAKHIGMATATVGRMLKGVQRNG